MEDFHERYHRLRSVVDARLATLFERDRPATVYEPARYVLGGGGKRVRPVLAILACEAVGGTVADALDTGVAVEILHNFTLVHDDIMDNAAQRRGRETVHVRWDRNVAILVGDELIGIAYRVLLRAPCTDVRELAAVFTEGMIDVCEGQSYDKEFEAREDVDETEYLMMIGKKTGRLVSMSTELGALAGGAAPGERAALARFGASVGRAFQIQDDLLDVVADERAFGKTIGGDILEGKKTYLLVTALAKAAGTDREVLRRISARREVPDAVATVRDIYERLGIVDEARAFVRRETERAVRELADVRPGPARDMLAWTADMLLRRDS